MTKRFSEKQKNRMIYLYHKDRLSISGVARKMGISRTTARKYLVERNAIRGFTPKSLPWTNSEELMTTKHSYLDEELMEIKRLYLDEKLSAQKIAIKLGMKERTVARKLRRLGITRSKKDAMRIRFNKKEISQKTEIQDPTFIVKRNKLLMEYIARIQPKFQEYQAKITKDDKANKKRYLSYRAKIKPELDKLHLDIANLKVKFRRQNEIRL